MKDPIDLQPANPSATAILRAGVGIVTAPAGISNGPFLVQTLLSSHMDGEMTATRTFIPPGVITHWHSHPRGQLFFILDGVGLIQREGGDIIEVRAGDSIWFSPGERHWHGAAPASPFSYLSIQPVQNGTAVHWMEPVIP